jgi:hypothetical protein
MSKTEEEMTSFGNPGSGRYDGGSLLIGVALVILLAMTSARAQDLGTVGATEPVRVGGSVSARFLGYEASGISDRRSPFSWILSGNVNVDLYDLSLPFSFTFSEQERSFSQPFNQFGVSPHYEWITAHLGYRNLSFSPFTLAGHQILGAGVELNPGKLRFGFIAGELASAVEEDTTRIGQTPAYERTGFGGRLGYGTESDHFDLIVLKGVDDTSSLRRAPLRDDIRPAENLVLGANIAATITDGLSVHGDFAVSDYTRDLRSDELSLSAEAEALGDAITPRASTQIYTALSAGLALNIETFNLQASYTRIDPDYQSMGAYYLGGDLEQFSVAPSVALLGSTLFFNGSFSLQHDNIQGKKRATTERISPSLGIYYAASPAFGINLQAAALMTSQTAGTVPLNDTIRMDQSAPSLSISPHYTIQQESTATHSFNASVNYAAMIDHNGFTAGYSEYTNIGADLSYGLSLPRSGLTTSGSVSINRLTYVSGTASTFGVAAGAGKSLLDQTLDIDASLALSFHEGGRTINGTVGGSWRPAEHHSVGASISITTSGGSSNLSSFNEYTSVLSYVYSF